MSFLGSDKGNGEELAISKETVIATPKEKIISTLADNLGESSRGVNSHSKLFDNRVRYCCQDNATQQGLE